MKAIELAKAYDPKSFEDRIYEEWKSKGLFQPQSVPVGSPVKKPFVVVIPPPNVTGVLHMGHSLNHSLQDIAVRFHRMTGRPTLWLPGSDHAGIATQNVVEKRLRAGKISGYPSGTDRHSLGREKFIEETWKVANEHKAFIQKQVAKIGDSVDWSRERFTLDEGLSKAVREVFVTLHERGLIYKGKYLVNWCSSCGTALSDDEVEKHDESGKMWRIWYELVGPADEENIAAGGVTIRDGKAYIEIATTRPETLLGDVAVAANPADPRYGALVGRKLRLPLTDRVIPLIADSYVDMAFGSGLVKITPAHDINDFEVGNRHDLDRINILDAKGRLNDNVPSKYQGLDVEAARKLVLEDLRALGLVKAEEDIVHAVGHCYRCDTRIEPWLSEQWFVKMKPLAEKALKAWRDGEVRFFPTKWEHTYEHWLENIRDWCVSRQLWWGHRVPVWYCRHCGLVMVEREEPTICPKCKSTDIYQDEDVLDTWFSSWLWPFSTLGWPKDTADFRKFYPTSTLVTAYDIIFFWVARMIMAGLEFTGKSPFKDVYIHGLVRDKQGRKMSKSLGNGIDPLEIVDEYGADALRFTLAYNCAAGQDVLLDRESFKMGSRFANKVWNASRYILMNLEGREMVESPELRDLDLWIRGRLASAAASCRSSIADYRFNEAAQAAYSYFWDDFCDWYIEGTKLAMKSGDAAEKDRQTTILLEILEESLRLLHPFLPFVTEEIYRMLPNSRGMLIVQEYPGASAPALKGRTEGESEIGTISPANDAVVRDGFGALQELVGLARTLRAEFQIPPETPLRLAVKTDEGFAGSSFLRANAVLAGLFVNGPAPEFVAAKPSGQSGAGAVGMAGPGFEAWAYVREVVDIPKLVAKLGKDADKEAQYVDRTKAKLANEAFVNSAPAEIVAKEREKLAEAERRVARLRQYAEELA
ncbi:MAG TPA: valine--tRNA ligase [Rectinemataceae bacterium]|nr:valine--tRNA ligase [Rectinemataceae bacterium]